jgi:hypothetical protein
MYSTSSASGRQKKLASLRHRQISYIFPVVDHGFASTKRMAIMVGDINYLFNAFVLCSRACNSSFELQGKQIVNAANTATFKFGLIL